MNLKKAIETITKDWEDRTDLYLSDINENNYPDIKDIETIEELTEILEDNQFFDAEVIYYYNAMKYLSEEDPSLQYSMELAHDIGFECKNINSELLASLLQTEKNREDWHEIAKELEDLIIE